MNTRKYGCAKLRALSQARQARLGRLWDTKLKDPLAFVPKTVREKGLSITEARQANTQFGEFSAGYLKKVIARLTRKDDIARRLAEKKIIMAIGYGYGYDSKWLRQALRAGLQTWWVDVSSLTWMWATQSMDRQFSLVCQPPGVSYMKPQVRTCEIQSMLAEPEKADLDVGKVEMWYLCRLLNCLSTRSAKAVLQEIGRTALGVGFAGSDSFKKNAVVIVNALSDDNSPDPCTGVKNRGTSIVRSKKMILANLSLGAGRPVEARFVETYQYFGKLVTAMTIMAK